MARGGARLLAGGRARARVGLPDRRACRLPGGRPPRAPPRDGRRPARAHGAGPPSPRALDARADAAPGDHRLPVPSARVRPRERGAGRLVGAAGEARHRPHRDPERPAPGGDARVACRRARGRAVLARRAPPSGWPADLRPNGWRRTVRPAAIGTPEEARWNLAW